MKGMATHGVGSSRPAGDRVTPTFVNIWDTCRWLVVAGKNTHTTSKHVITGKKNQSIPNGKVIFLVVCLFVSLRTAENNCRKNCWRKKYMLAPHSSTRCRRCCLQSAMCQSSSPSRRRLVRLPAYVPTRRPTNTIMCNEHPLLGLRSAYPIANEQCAQCRCHGGAHALADRLLAHGGTEVVTVLQ